MRQIEEEDDTPGTCPEDSNLTVLNVNCRGLLGGRNDNLTIGESGLIPSGIVGLNNQHHNNIMVKNKMNQNTSVVTTHLNSVNNNIGNGSTGTANNNNNVGSTTSTSMRKTKRSPNERRFKCDQCDRMFFTRKDVKRHLVVHTGVRNYACPFCQQRFGRKDHLVRHAKKSHQKDTRASATASAANLAAAAAAAAGAAAVAGLGPPGSSASAAMNHHHAHHRRLTFAHSPVHHAHHGLPGSPTLNHHPGRMIVNVNANLHSNNSGSSNQSLSPCNYSSSNVGPVMDQSSPLLLLGTGPGGTTVNGINGSGSNVAVSASSLVNCSSNGSTNGGVGSNGSGPNTGCTINGNGIVSNSSHHAELCYPGNTSGHHNSSMPGSINDGHFNGPPPPHPPHHSMGHHTSLCETTSLFNNGGHYFNLGAGPSPFMNPAYITNCFGHITVNPGNPGPQGLSGVPSMCGSDQPSPVFQ